MPRTLTITWIVLLLITLGVSLLIWLNSKGDFRVQLIMVLSGLKFFLVSWFFLGLRHTHTAWKFLIIAFTVLVFLLLALNA